MEGKIRYQFTAKIWQHPSPGGWHFISVPKGLSTEIRRSYKKQEQGWGRLTAKVRTGSSEWMTSIWFDSKYEGYLLPLSVGVRKKEDMSLGKRIKVEIWV